MCIDPVSLSCSVSFSGLSFLITLPGPDDVTTCAEAERNQPAAIQLCGGTGRDQGGYLYFLDALVKTLQNILRVLTKNVLRIYKKNPQFIYLIIFDSFVLNFNLEFLLK